MKNDELKIEILGSTNTGKSTLLYLIKETLKEKGINVKFEDIDFDNDEKRFDKHFRKNLNERINMLKNRKIKISTKNIGLGSIN